MVNRIRNLKVKMYNTLMPLWWRPKYIVTRWLITNGWMRGIVYACTSCGYIEPWPNTATAIDLLGVTRAGHVMCPNCEQGLTKVTHTIDIEEARKYALPYIE